MRVWLFDSKAFGHLREGGQKDEGLPESSSLGALGAPGPGGMAFFLSGPLVPRVENGAHKAYCPFSLKCSLQWLNWWERRGLREVKEARREVDFVWRAREGGIRMKEGPAQGTDTLQWEPCHTHTSPPSACRAHRERPGSHLHLTFPSLHLCTQEGRGPRLQRTSIAGSFQKGGHNPVGCHPFSDSQAAVRNTE